MKNDCEISTIDHFPTGYVNRLILRTQYDKCSMLKALMMPDASTTREDKGVPYIRTDCEGTWEGGCSISPRTEEAKKKGKEKRGTNGMTKIMWVSSEGHRRVVEYNELSQLISDSTVKLKSFIKTTMRFHVSITYLMWKHVPRELKDQIYELIEGGFIVDSRSRKSILQNASVSYRQFKSSLTTSGFGLHL
ncbi:transposase [Cucumis melo var. makuwa]|uniref:Transposase n=1 Tax=Cucumis melo var. makuwa TaxID=1194695 RepID=A0A5A7SLF1_CUCMM|nr:transposase [Cucumis melo var. makuwa]TYK00371.1 transposase [Cucumis melo var. makuwa]